MPITINGTTGLAGVDGSAGTPAVQGADANTGIFFPAADTIAFAEGGVEVMRIDSSGNVGIGTSSILGSTKLEVYGNSSAAHVGIRANNAAADGYATLWLSNSGTNDGIIRGGATAASYANQLAMLTGSAIPITFSTNNTERMRISSAGRVSINTTYADTQLNIAYNGGAVRGVDINNTVSGNQDAVYFRTNGTNVGRINTDASNTSYVTSSDYRLKENITLMTGALSKVALLKPVTYKWKVDGSNGQGFIAHELAEVVPDCVTGEKDAVEIYTDEDGNEQTRIKPQGIDTSFLVATLTAAIQEQQALITQLQADVAALKGTP